MTVLVTGALRCRQRQVCSVKVLRPNWKAECRETGLLRLERGKGREALPIAICVLESLPASMSVVLARAARRRLNASRWAVFAPYSCTQTKADAPQVAA